MRILDAAKTMTKIAGLVLAAGACLQAYGQSFTPPAVATATITMPYSDLSQSQAIAVDSSGDLFFTRPASGILAEKPASGGPEIALYTAASGGGGYPKGVAANDTYAYMTDYSGSLWQVAINGGAATNILGACNSLDGGYLGSQEVAVDGLGNVYVAGNNLNSLFKIAGGSCTIVSGVTLDSNSHVSADAVGNLAYSTGGVLYSRTVGAAASVVVPGTFNSIVGLRADNAGNVFVTTYSGIVEVPFVNGALDGTRAFTVLTGSSQNDVAVSPSGTIYTTDGTNIFKNVPGAVRYASTTVGTTSPAQTVTAVFNSTQVLTSIRYAAGTGTSSEITNTGAGSCATGQTYTAGASCTITLTFKPQGLGARNGAVLLSSATGVIGSVAVAGQGSGAGLAVDPGTQTNLGATWQSPASVAVGSSGGVVVADKSAGTVTYFPAGSTTGTVIASGLAQPVAVAIAADGTVYAATSGGSLIQIPYTGTAYGSAATVATGLKSPGGVAVGPGGSVYVANTSAGTVLRFPNESGARDFGSSSVVGTGFKTPAGLAFDASGNLLVADSTAGTIYRVTATSTAALVSGLTSPIAVAVDDSGSLYVAQSGTASALRIAFTNGSYNSNSATSLGTGFTTVASIAMDSAGNVYVADSGAPAVVLVQRVAGSLNLGKINVGSSSTTQSLSLSDNGDLPLTFGSPLYTASGNTTDFTIASSGSNACSGGGTLATGWACTLGGTFTPTVTGARSEQLTFKSNAVNAATVTGTFLGTGINLPKTTLALTTNPSGTVSYGTAVVATAVVSAPAGSSATPTGTVTFLVNGVSYSVQTLSGGSASVSITGLTAGSNTIDAVYSGDNNYAASSGATQTVVVTLAPTVTTFTSSINSSTPVAPNTSVTLTAVVSSSVTSAKPTGTVNFVSNGVTLASAPVNASTGVATVTTTTLPTGNLYAITAVYSGDSGFASSSSASITVSIRVKGYDIANAPTALTVSAPGSVSTTFSIVPISGYVGAVDMSCSGLPANTQCTFLPASVMFGAGAGPQPVQLTVTTYTPAPTKLAGFLAPFSLLLLGFYWRGRKNLRRGGVAMTLGVMLAGLTAMASLSGCGNSNANATPKGTSTVTVNFVGSPDGTTTVPTNGAGNLPNSFTFTLTVQ